MHVLMTGASGLIGRHLCRALVRRGDQVIAVSRSAQPQQAGVSWHVGDTQDPQFLAEPLAGCDAAINLAGASVATRWSASYKRTIAGSRLGVTQALSQAFRLARAKSDACRTLVSTSAVGYYGFANAGPCAEDAPLGAGFLAQVCHDWESAAQDSEIHGARCVRLRLGIVLSTEGGALPQILAPIRAMLGAPLGSGQQWMSWVHIDDVVGMYLKALDDGALHGAINVVAPQPVSNADLTKTAAKILGKPLWAPRVPGAVLRLAMGQMADEMLLGGQQVVPKAALAAGYAFAYPQLQGALTQLLAK
jgi:hypothetical protein